jgi:hypothetical protein
MVLMSLSLHRVSLEGSARPQTNAQTSSWTSLKTLQVYTHSAIWFLPCAEPRVQWLGMTLRTWPVLIQKGGCVYAALKVEVTAGNTKVRVSALHALGCLSIARPNLMLRERARELQKATLQRNALLEFKVRALNNLADLLKVRSGRQCRNLVFAK